MVVFLTAASIKATRQSHSGSTDSVTGLLFFLNWSVTSFTGIDVSVSIKTALPLISGSTNADDGFPINWYTYSPSLAI